MRSSYFLLKSLLLLTFCQTLLVPASSSAVSSRKRKITHNSPALLKSIPEKAPTHQLSSFCKKFLATCTDTCVHDKVGEQKIAVSCGKVKHSVDYKFSCHCNGHERTAQALKKISGAAAGKVTTSIIKGTTIFSTSEIDTTSTFIPDEVTSTSTEQDVSTTQLPDVSTTTSATETTVLSPSTDTTQTFLSTTTETPLATSFITVTSTSLTTSTSTSTSFSVASFVAGERVAVLKVATPKKANQSGDTNSTFCKAYSRSCTRECARVKSSVRNEVCKKTRTSASSEFYDLHCVCANKKTESLHALNNIDVSDPNHSFTATLLSTSTSVTYTTKTALETASVITRTTVLTQSSTLTYVATSTSTSVIDTTTTFTAPTSTSTSSTSQTITETAPTSTITSAAFTATSSSTEVIPTSTLVILAPTGRVRVDVDGSQTGYLHDPTGTFRVEMSVRADASDAINFALSKSTDPAYPDRYQLVHASDPTLSMGGTFNQYGSRDYATATCDGTSGDTTGGFLDQYPAQSGPGLSTTRGGTYNGWSNNYMWKLDTHSVSAAGVDQFRLQPNWINPDGSTADVGAYYLNDDPTYSSAEIVFVACNDRYNDDATLFFETSPIPDSK